MTEDVALRVHWSFWVIALFALLWNIGGSINYILQTDLEFVATLPDTHKAIIEGRPVWATGGFALGVFGGSIGSLLLLLKKHSSLYMFIASLAGIAVTMIHTINVAYSTTTFTFAEIFVMIALPIIVAVLVIWYTIVAKRKHWIS
ncbi:MAG: hypothetical protein R3240_13270 [Gammaproteobacteria bacterium]|nr:hypothetical protein [Gammaproteobacteria bacterium]